MSDTITYQDGTTTEVCQTPDGKWTARLTTPAGQVQELGGWPNIETARMVAGQMRSGPSAFSPRRTRYGRYA